MKRTMRVIFIKLVMVMAALSAHALDDKPSKSHVNSFTKLVAIFLNSVATNWLKYTDHESAEEMNLIARKDSEDDVHPRNDPLPPTTNSCDDIAEVNHLVISGVPEDFYEGRFLLFDAKILRNLRREAQYEPHWGVGQRQCFNILYWAHALHNHPMEPNLDMKNGLPFGQYAPPKKLCQFLGERIPREFLLSPTHVPFTRLEDTQLTKIIENELTQGRLIAALYKTPGKPTRDGKKTFRMALASIIGIANDDGKIYLLLILTTPAQSFVTMQPIEVVLNAMDLKVIRKTVDAYLEYEDLFRLTNPANQTIIDVAKQMKDQLNRFNLITFGPPDNQDEADAVEITMDVISADSSTYLDRLPTSYCELITNPDNHVLTNPGNLGDKGRSFQ